MENLPVEIIHRIFDHLDIETIFFSIRPVCRLFRSIVQNYNRFDFHSKNISKTRFNVLCQMISSENIRSLTLYNNQQVPDQISLFLSQIRLRQLTRLHSIHLFGIDEFQLNYLSQRINLDLLKSFSIQIGKYDDRRKKTTARHLSAIVNRPTLREMHMKINNYRYRISEISWPMNCSIQCFTFDGEITYDNLVKIFSCSPRLHRLIIKEKCSWLIDRDTLRSSFPQLTSLILEEVNVNITQLESFLLLTPSLIYLKLIANCQIFDGKRWEEFIQVNLPRLNQFEFDINCERSIRITEEVLETTFESFRSLFWIEYKKWFVTVEVHSLDSYDLRISSIPTCKSIYETDFNSNKICLSTSDDIFQTKKIDQIKLRLKMSLTESILTSINLPYFPNVIKLHIYFDEEVSINLIDYLPRIINVFQLIEVKLESLSFNRDNENVLCDVLKLLEQSTKLSSLIIHSHGCQYEIYPFLERIFPILSRQIKYLRISIEETKQIETIFDRCPHLAVLQIPTRRMELSTQISQWFEEKTIGSISRRINECDTIWIGKKKEQNDFNPKRMKLPEQF